MIVGIGTDIVSIERIEAMLSRQGDAIARRILADQEWQQFQTANQPAAFLAKRFAAKEAPAKAFGTGSRDCLSLQHIIVTNNEMGQPAIHFEDRAAELATQLNIQQHHISLSDEQSYAIAYVILEK